jgi:hypothetical protein
MSTGLAGFSFHVLNKQSDNIVRANSLDRSIGQEIANQNSFFLRFLRQTNPEKIS